MSSSVTGRLSSGSITCSSALRIASRSGLTGASVPARRSADERESHGVSRISLLLSAVALLVALLGSTPLGEAALEAALPRASVGTAELRDGAVTGAKVKDRSLVARDFKAGQLPRGPAGPKGPPGSIAGMTASGDLTGTFPAPMLAPDSIEAAEVKDGSLGLKDTAALSGQVRIDVPAVAAHSCVSLRSTVPGVKPYDRAILLPTQNLPLGVSVTPVFNTNLAGRILFRVCNATAKPVDAPLGAWAYVVWR